MQKVRGGTFFFLIVLWGIALFSSTHVVRAEEIAFPTITLEDIQNSLPNPLLDFISSTKHLGDTFPQSLNVPKVNIDIPATKEWFASPEHFWNKFEQWIYDRTGISLNAMFGLVVTFIKAILSVLLWILNFIFRVIQYVLDLFT